MTATERQPLLISGLPGAMAAEVVALALDAHDLSVLPVGLTSDARDGSVHGVNDHSIQLVALERADFHLPPGTIAVDYSTPDAALDNARWFVKQGLPFVMGTTGFDTTAMKALLADSAVSAVIAPNMAPPIVLLQAAMRWLAATYPGGCGDAQLTIRESHQQAKRDTSGTARALARSFQGLGIDFDIDRIERIRDPETQRAQLGVPPDFLDAHAFHRYELALAGGTVDIVLEHNVRGRRVYAEGTLHAVRFLRARIDASVTAAVYDMEDVLRDPAGP